MSPDECLEPRDGQASDFSIRNPFFQTCPKGKSGPGGFSPRTEMMAWQGHVFQVRYVVSTHDGENGIRS